MRTNRTRPGGGGGSRLLAGVLLFAALASAASGCGRRKDSVSYGHIETEYLYMASEFGGNLERLFVERGMRIKAGETVFKLETTGEEAGLEKSMAALAEARQMLEDMLKGRRPSEMAAFEAVVSQMKSVCDLSELELRRVEKLRRTNSTSEKEHDNARLTHAKNLTLLAEARARLETARLGERDDVAEAQRNRIRAIEADIKQARWRMSRKTVASPENASVFDTFYREGEYVPASRPVAALVSPRYLKIRFFATNMLAGKLRPGTPLGFTYSGAGRMFRAEVSYIAPEPEYNPPVIYSREMRDRLMFMVEARILSEDKDMFHPGMPVEVFLEAK